MKVRDILNGGGKQQNRGNMGRDTEKRKREAKERLKEERESKRIARDRNINLHAALLGVNLQYKTRYFHEGKLAS